MHHLVDDGDDLEKSRNGLGDAFLEFNPTDTWDYSEVKNHRRGRMNFFGLIELWMFPVNPKSTGQFQL